MKNTKNHVGKMFKVSNIPHSVNDVIYTIKSYDDILQKYLISWSVELNDVNLGEIDYDKTMVDEFLEDGSWKEI